MISFTNLLFSEALAASQKRQVLTSDVYYTKAPYQARAASFSVAGLQSIAQLETIFNSLNQALSSGKTFSEWQTALAENSAVFSSLPQWRKELIYQMHTQTAYHMGQWDQIQESYQAGFILSLKYIAIMDSRTRPTHAAMNGIIRPVGDPFWTRFYPPNGYNCRCGVIALSRETLQQEGGDSDISQLNIEPDKGFDYHPSESAQYLQAYFKQKLNESTLPSDIKSVLDKKFNLPPDEMLIKQSIGELKFNAVRSEFSQEINQAVQLGLTEAEAIAIREVVQGAPAINQLLSKPNLAELDNMQSLLSVAKKGLNKLKTAQDEAIILSENKGFIGDIQIGGTIQTESFIFIPEHPTTAPQGTPVDNNISYIIHTKESINLAPLGIPIRLIEPDNQFYISGTVHNYSQINYILLDQQKKEALLITFEEEDIRKLLQQRSIYQYLTGLHYESY